MSKNIKERLNAVKASLPESVRLVAVSKFHPVESIREAYDAGQRCFGENKVQELLSKQPLLPSDIEWHLIGHLQTNKVKQIVPFISLIQSVDSVKLLNEINKQAAVHGRVIDCLIQIYIATEESKFGFSPEQCKSLFADGTLAEFKNIRICGLMGMASFTHNEAQIRREFKTLTSLFHEIKSTICKDIDFFKEISFGMSDDYPIAIDCGSTMVRVGSKIFGARRYL